MKSTVYSGLKVLYHTEKIEDLKQGKRTAPVYVRIKPTNICNQKCYYCVYADDQVFENRSVNRKESIPWEKMNEIINDIADMGVKAVTFSGGGEPLCYHSIIPTLHLVKQKGLDYSVITNGQELCGEKAVYLTDAKWVRVSLDSASKEMYERIRGVDTFDSVIKNIGDFAKRKNEECQLGINFVVTEDNARNIYSLCCQMRDIGVNNIKFSPLMVKDKTPEYHSSIKKIVETQLERAKRELSTDSFAIIDKYSDDLMLDINFTKAYHKCYMKELFTVIAADQKVYFCHQKAYKPDGLIGDLREKSFKELWFSQETTDIFQNMDAARECNFRCAFEERNILLNDLFGIDKNHINFI